MTKNKDQEIEKEEQTHEECSTEKCQEYLDGWKRALADYDNLKKNLVTEKGELRRAVAEDHVEPVRV